MAERVTLNPVLRDFWTAPARNRVLKGGRSSSKSWDAAGFAIFLASNFKVRFLCTRQFQNKIEESVYTLLKIQIERFGLRAQFEVYNNKIVHRTTGSEFIFYGLWRHIDEIKSLEGIDICWIEEAHNLTKDQWDILEPTLRKEGSQFWIIFNPRLVAMPSDPPKRRDTWAILRVTPNMERKVAGALGPKSEANRDAAGLSVYIPIEKYRPANQWRPRTRPLMPGYVFADLPDDRTLDIARANHAVRDIMCHDSGVPFRLSGDVIGAMVLFEAWRVFDRTWKPPPYKARKRGGRKAGKSSFREARWEHGKRVRIKDGPFAGFLGTIMATPRDQRVEVLTAIFGRQTTVELGENEVEDL